MAVAPLPTAKPDAPQQPMAIVTTEPVVIRQGGSTYTVPAGQVVRLLNLPAITSFRAPAGHKIIPAGTLAVGETTTL